jgi:muconolactone delta-isomerase
MLFLVVSTPGPTKPSAMRNSREEYWNWLQPLIDAGKVRHNYARAGRGAVAIVDVDSNDELHVILNQWCELIPTKFDVYPLLDPETAQDYLRATAPAED